MKLIRFQNCIPVKGHKRSVLIDLQRNDIKIIPNGLYTILFTHNGKTIQEIKKVYKNEFDDIIDEYVKFILDNEFGFINENPEMFPELSLDWFSPSKVTNAIIDINEKSTFSIKTVLSQLTILGCFNLEVRFFKIINLEELRYLFNYLKEINSSIIGVSCIFKYSKNININELSLLINQYPRLISVIIYSSPESSLIKNEHQNGSFIQFVKQDVDSEKCCGIIKKEYFTLNLSAFTESQKYNSCLNKKISIDTEGNIKNCPSMPQSFGNINDTSLEEALNHLDFKKYWNIAKDQIEICKDCEFRYICTDCRAYKENPDNDYSKPLKCGYNPYTNVWEEWSTNPLKQKAIEYYGMQELVKKNG